MKLYHIFKTKTQHEIQILGISIYRKNVTPHKTKYKHLCGLYRTIYLNKDNTLELIKLLGVVFYKKEIKPGKQEITYLEGIYKTIILQDDIMDIYAFGIKIYSKVLPIRRSQINTVLRRIDDIYYNIQVLSQVPIVHKYFAKYKNCHIGQDIYLIAGGPTVKYYNHKETSGLQCGVNGIIALIDNLDYLFIEDVFIHDKNLNNEIDNYKGNNCQKFYGILPTRRLRILNRNKIFTKRISPLNIYNSQANVFLLEDVASSKWAIDLEVEAFGDFGGAALSALQFLLYTHPKRIFLVGNDCSDGQLAYHSDRPQNSDHSGKIKNYKSLKQFADDIYPDVEIISINPVGLKGIFHDVYTKEYLQEHPEIKSDQVEILN